MSVVTIKYDDLINKNCQDQILEAYGPKGLGALTISGIPGYKENRERLLSLGYKLAHLPAEELAALEDPDSYYGAGWSHGKERFTAEPDLSKGSFYANPINDSSTDPEQHARWPFYNPTNKWPTKALPELEEAFKRLGKTMYGCAVHLAKQIDALVAARVPTFVPGSFYEQMKTTDKVTGRLLYYFPTETLKEDGWIGWHNDSGFLTTLTSAIFLDEETGQVVENPDPNGGLWIVNRGSEPVKVNIPQDHLTIQCGECLQIITGGLLVATPHCVRPSRSPVGTKIARVTFPCFVSSRADYKLSAPPGTEDHVFDNTVNSKVPPLADRWTPGETFADFLGNTFKRFYVY